jgi:hypothetical protein
VRVAHPATVAAIAAVLATVAAYGWLLAPQLGKPFVYDDVNFALGAEAVARTGLPFGNQGYLLHLYEQREQWALWHPPLYIYALGLTMALFGSSEAALRSLGIACQILAAGLTFDLARRLAVMRDEPRATSGERSDPPSSSGPTPLLAGALAVALFLLAPLNVQAALVLDIDNTVLMLLIAFYVWVAVRLPGLWDRRTTIGLALLYALTLWAKLTTPLLLLAALLFTRLFQGTGPRGALQALVVGAIGWAIFLLSWVVVTSLTGMPLDYTFVVVYREAMDSQASSRERFASWSAFVDGAAPALLWIGPFLALLFLAAGLPRLWRLVRGRGLAPTDLVVVLGAVVYLLYMMKLAGGFPKYHAAMLPLWAAACGAAVARAAGRPSPGQVMVFAIGSLAALGWLAVQMPDWWDLRLGPELARRLLLVPLAIGAATWALWCLVGRAAPVRALPIPLAALALAWSLALSLHQRGLDGSTAYYYGRYGQLEAAAALVERLRPDELYIASKEVAWYSANRRYVDQESWHHAIWDVGGGRFDGTWLGEEVRLVILEVGEETVLGTYRSALLPRYQSIEEYGNFWLLERR